MNTSTPANGHAGNSNSNSENNSNTNNNRTNSIPQWRGDSNTNNNRINSMPQWRGGNQRGGGADALRNFKGAIETLPVLGTKVEKANQDFSKFGKAILNHVLTNFTYPQDIAYAITDLKDPTKRVTQDLPTKAKMMQENDLELEDETTGTDAEKLVKVDRNKDIEETIEYMRKAAFAEYNKRKTAGNFQQSCVVGINHETVLIRPSAGHQSRRRIRC